MLGADRRRLSCACSQDLCNSLAVIARVQWMDERRDDCIFFHFHLHVYT